MENLSKSLLFSADTILLVTAAHVGNVLFCLPAIHYLKKHLPKTSFDVVVLHKRAFDIFKNNPMVRRAYIKQTRYSLQRLIKKYPLTICLNHVTTEKYLKNCDAMLWSVPPSDPHQHRAEEVLQYVQNLLKQPIVDEDRRYWIYPQTNDLVHMKNAVQPQPQKIMIGVHLGSSRTQIHGWKFWYKKRTHDPRLWPLDYYINLAYQLQKANSRIQFVLTGDKNERFLGEVFAKRITNTVNLMGKTTLAELAALMSYLQVFVTHDTGVLHVASASNVPIVSLFGHTDHKRSGPYPVAEQRIMLQSNQVSDILPEQVCANVLALL